MKSFNFCLVTGTCVLLAGCVTTEPCRMPVTTIGPEIIRTGTEKQIRAAAQDQADEDIAAGKPRVAETGGFACWAVGVPQEQMDLVKNLPRIPLPCGCTESYLGQAAIYAEAYNKRILAYLLTKTEFQNPIH